MIYLYTHRANYKLCTNMKASFVDKENVLHEILSWVLLFIEAECISA